MIEFTKTSTRTSIGRVYSAIVNQARKVTLVLFFLALVMTVQPHSVDATTLSSLGSVSLERQAEGVIDKVTGKAETKLNQTKDMARKVNGKVTREMGRMDSRGEGMKNRANEAVDDSNNILDDLGDKIQSTADGIADSVKSLGK